MQQNLFDSFNVKVDNNKLEEEQQKKMNIQKQMPWVEKYRPNQLNEISFQDEIVQALNGVLQTGNLPHLLLYGPPGTGKTSSILALAKQLWGQEFYRQRILELNASDDRGIKVVREKIKKFAQTVPNKNKDKQYLSPNYKIIILDEADLMTNDAQSALRRIIEDYSANTRFCIICNYITKIIQPLASRCIKYQFKPISIQAQVDKLQSISYQEQLIVQDQQAFHELIKVTEGDLRRSVNLLQSVSILFDKNINIQNINEISGRIPDSIIQFFINSIKEVKTIENVIAIVDNFLLQGYSAYQVLQQVIHIIFDLDWIDQPLKVQLLLKISEIEANLSLGARDDLQLYDLFSIMIK